MKHEQRKKFFMLKNLLIFSLSAGLGFALSVHAMEEPTGPYHEFSKTISQQDLIDRYSISPELKSVIDINLPKIITKPKEFPWLPGFIMKHEHGRVIGSLLIRNAAQKHGCNLVTAPPAQWYNTQWGQRCSVERMIQISKVPFSIQQAKQLYKICKVTNYSDIHDGNIFNTSDGIMTIVDTERHSFMYNGVYTKLDYLQFMKNLNFTHDAQQWLQKKIKKYEKKGMKSILNEPEEAFT